MDKSRIIRVGTRTCVICIAAVSQEHVPVCTTRKKTRAARPKGHGFSVDIESDLVVVWVVKIDLISVWGS